jgi:CheY-like chemotaxis protein
LEQETPVVKWRVLLAEDDEAIRRTLQSLLELKGYEVRHAEDTPATLELLQEQDFDLIISDYLMPGGGGREILRFLNKSGKDPAVIMITGLADEQLFQELRTSGVDRCLSKPFRLASLIETIEEIMAERAAG